MTRLIISMTEFILDFGIQMKEAENRCEYSELRYLLIDWTLYAKHDQVKYVNTVSGMIQMLVAPLHSWMWPFLYLILCYGRIFCIDFHD